jgi:hypothetical protein
MINNGLNLDLERQHQSDEDWVFGAASPTCIALIPEGDREKYLPVGEVQKGKEDTMDCATRGPINILEAKFSYLYTRRSLSDSNIKWLYENGYTTDDGYVRFSDAFIAIKSGTTHSGNSLKAPLQAIHDNGLIPKSMLPLEPWMTFDDYHNPNRITPKMVALAEEFKRRFLINYDRVQEELVPVVYEEDMVILAGYAWPDAVNGEYPRTDRTMNHVFVGIRNPTHYIFDNYIDPVDGDFVKKLASDYKLFQYGYRTFITELSAEVVVEKKESAFVRWIKSFWALITLKHHFSHA